MGKNRVSYFSIAVKRHYDQGKESVPYRLSVLVCDHYGRKQRGFVVEQMLRTLHPDPKTTGRERGHCMAWTFKTSKSFHINTPPPIRPYLLPK